MITRIYRGPTSADKTKHLFYHLTHCSVDTAEAGTNLTDFTDAGNPSCILIIIPEKQPAPDFYKRSCIPFNNAYLIDKEEVTLCSAVPVDALLEFILERLEAHLLCPITEIHIDDAHKFQMTVEEDQDEIAWLTDLANEYSGLNIYLYGRDQDLSGSKTWLGKINETQCGDIREPKPACYYCRGKATRTIKTKSNEEIPVCWICITEAHFNILKRTFPHEKRN